MILTASQIYCLSSAVRSRPFRDIKFFLSVEAESLTLFRYRFQISLKARAHTFCTCQTCQNRDLLKRGLNLGFGKQMQAIVLDLCHFFGITINKIAVNEPI